MLIELLFVSPILYLMFAVSILFSFTVHEYSHSQAAFSLGDPTPKIYGRLTLNPVSHFDPFFTSLIFILGIGMGKPVPFNPINLKNQKWGPAMVALAGPVSNLLLALMSSLILRFLNFNFENFEVSTLFYFLSVFTWINIILAFFNLIPLPPLDGFHVFSIIPFFSRLIKIFLSRDNFIFFFFSIFLAIFLMWEFIVPFICKPLFYFLTGSSQIIF